MLLVDEVYLPCRSFCLILQLRFDAAALGKTIIQMEGFSHVLVLLSLWLFSPKYDHILCKPGLTFLNELQFGVDISMC